MKWNGYRYIVLMLMICIFLIGCQNKKVGSLNKTTTREGKVIREKTSEKESETDRQEIADFESRDLKIEEVTGSTVEQSTTVSATQKNTTSSTKIETHTHEWVAQTKTVHHAEEGRYETKVIQEAYNEVVYAWRTFCNKCGNDISDLKADEVAFHSAILCGSGYHADYVVVETIHHDAITEQVWVVDKAAWTETITTDYKCDCGATK